MKKTYEQRISEIAEEMAKANISTWDKLPAIVQGMHINQWKACATIAIKHMAEEWQEGYISGVFDTKNNIDSPTIERQLRNIGLHPQK